MAGAHDFAKRLYSLYSAASASKVASTSLAIWTARCMNSASSSLNGTGDFEERPDAVLVGALIVVAAAPVSSSVVEPSSSLFSLWGKH